MKNQYSNTWYSMFMDTIPSTKTSEEIDFIKSLIPQKNYPYILDLCCGTGRHLKELSKLNYTLLGIDSNKRAMEEVRNLNLKNVTLKQEDMFDFSLEENSLNAVICMWQSFGYGSNTQNEKLVKSLWNALRSDGLVLLDIYNKDFFERFLGERNFEYSGTTVTETKTMSGNRLTIKLSYGNSQDSDIFDWVIFSPTEIVNFMKELNFELAGSYSGFSSSQAPSIDNPRAQYLFRKSN